MKKLLLLIGIASFPARGADAPPCEAEKPCADQPLSPPVAGSTGAAAAPFPSELPPPPPGAPALPPARSAPPEMSPSKWQVTVERYPTGEVLAERRAYDGRLDGVSKEFYKNGQAMNEWLYGAGKLDGVSRAYFRNGDLMSERRYRKGKLHGESKFYHERGLLKSVEVYKDGELVRRKSYNAQGLPFEEAR